jgi:phospholipid/cholesterol/gamma-HCH transport system substrate-binding protein
VPVLKSRFEEMNLLRIGIVALVLLVIVLLIGLNSGSLYRQIVSTSYSAYFPEAAGLRSGDEVRVGGVVVGKVDDVVLRGNKVEAFFTVFDDARLGSTTGASIKTATALGSKYIAVLPAGAGQLDNDHPIPLDRTSSPYDVQELLERLTRTTQELDVDQLADALNTVSDTFADTPPALRGTIEGLGRLSQTIASRDMQLQTLLGNARGVTDILAQRSGNITTLITDGNALLEELYARRDTIRSLLINTNNVVNEFAGVVRDNQAQIGPALAELERVLDLLNENDRNLTASIDGLRTYVGSLGEAIGSGPWFYALVPNLAPTNLAQQNLPSLLQAATPPGLPGAQAPADTAPAGVGQGGGR